MFHASVATRRTPYKLTGSADMLTRHLHYRSDKLSRLALPSELIERRSPCGIRSLTEGGRAAPILRERSDGLKKCSRLQNDHTELYRKAQVAALVLAENRRRQIEQRSKLARFSQTQIPQNSEGEEKNDQ